MRSKIFTVEGRPFGKQRPRHNTRTGVTYTPKETHEYESIVAAEYIARYGTEKFADDDYICLYVAAYFSLPSNTSKAKRAKMLSGEIRPTAKPDWDNIGKIISDALNGVAYKDDKCIVSAHIGKYYSAIPRVVVTLEISESSINEKGKNDEE